MKSLARAVILSLVRLPRDWIRGLAIVVITVLLIELVINPLSSFIEDLGLWPLFSWINKSYRLMVVCLILFIALPIFISRIWPRIAILIGKIRAKKRGWKPALFVSGEDLLTGGEAWPAYITGTWTAELDGQKKVLLSVLKLTTPTPFTGFPSICNPEHVLLVKNIEVAQWAINDILYFMNNHSSCEAIQERVNNSHLVLERYSDAV